jgi:hypothetical protein
LGEEVRVNEPIDAGEGVEGEDASVLEQEHFIFKSPVLCWHQIGGHNECEKEDEGDTKFSLRRKL